MERKSVYPRCDMPTYTDSTSVDRFQLRLNEKLSSGKLRLGALKS